ncbi:MAG: hypothetical protein AB7E42_03240 [Anaerotignaceae bacterium]
MTQAELFAILKTIGLPITYYQWETPPALPYLVYLMTDTANFGADNKVYTGATNYNIELYANKKDPASEKLVEGLLNSNDIFWDKTEVYIDTERMFQVTYSITI